MRQKAVFIHNYHPVSVIQAVTNNDFAWMPMAKPSHPNSPI